MKPNEAKLPAVMSVERGETIVGAWVTPTIPEVGVYKLLAKRKVDGTCEWAHFVQRADGRKERVYRGDVESRMCWLQSIRALPEHSERRSRCAWLTPIFIHSTARSMRMDASSNSRFRGCNKSEIENPQSAIGNANGFDTPITPITKGLG